MTQRNAGWDDYTDRLNRVTAYIYDHLDDDIDLIRLADIACLSPYHWHRIYAAMQGETIAATVKRLRLHRAAGYLAHTSMAISDIAERTGYGNLQSFTRIFKAAYGLPPAQYRREGSHVQFQLQRKEKDSALYDVEIKTMPKQMLLGVEHAGSYMDIGKSFEILFGLLGTRRLSAQDMMMVGVYYDDPTAVPEHKLRSRACVMVNNEAPVEPPLVRAELAGGSYAILKYQGPYADMKPAYQWLYGVWLPRSGREAANAPAFEKYLNTPRDTAPRDLRTDIYLPLSA